MLLRCVMHVTDNQFSDMFNNGWKKFKIADLLGFFTFDVNNFTLQARKLQKLFMYPSQICTACF